MKVLVIKQIAANKRDLEIVIVVRVRPGYPIPGLRTTVSGIVRLEGKAPFASGNPYGVYGDAIAEFTGLDKLDCDITVAECTSGNLDGWR